MLGFCVGSGDLAQVQRLTWQTLYWLSLLPGPTIYFLGCSLSSYSSLPLSSFLFQGRPIESDKWPYRDWFWVILWLELPAGQTEAGPFLDGRRPCLFWIDRGLMNKNAGNGGLEKWLRPFLEDPSFVRSTHVGWLIVACNSSSRESGARSWPPQSRGHIPARVHALPFSLSPFLSLS